MENLKILKKALVDSGAKWSISEQLADNTTLEELKTKFSLGFLKAPANALTARMARIRLDSDNVVLAEPGTSRLKKRIPPKLAPDGRLIISGQLTSTEHVFDSIAATLHELKKRVEVTN